MNPPCRQHYIGGSQPARKLENDNGGELKSTWTMSLSAYLPLEDILTSSPSNSTMAAEEGGQNFIYFIQAQTATKVNVLPIKLAN